MNSMDVAIHATLHDHGGPKVLGPKMRLSPAVLSHKCNPHQPRNHLTVKEAVRLQAVTNDVRILNAMAAELGYLVVPLPDADPSDLELLTLYANWQDQTGQIHHAIAKAFADHIITPDEQEEIRQRFQTASSAGLTYIQRMGGLVQ